MTRHSKNASAGPTYTYHEKTKDCAQSGYGTVDMRLSKDSIKEFDCCSLTLQPFTNPVITPDGWIFDKEAILEYILHKKLENAKLMKLFEKQKQQKDKDLKELAEIENKAKIDKFLKSEGKLVASSVSSTPLSASVESTPSASSGATSSKPTPSVEPSTSAEATSESVNNMKGDNSKKLPSFWIPSLCPESKTQVAMKKPDTTIYCPMSGKPISMKDLIEVKFKLIDEKLKKDKASFISSKDRYVCAVSNDVLGNSVPCVVLKTSGVVVTSEVVDKIIKKDMIDPINGKKMTEKDIIPIQRGGTGFAGAGAKLTAKRVNPALIC